jgi:hypothetical protein
MVLSDSTSCSYGSIDSYNYTITTMKNKEKFDAQQQAYEIADDHYEYLNATFGAKYKDALLAASVSVEKVIEALHSVKLTKKVEKSIEQWREVLTILRGYNER